MPQGSVLPAGSRSLVLVVSTSEQLTAAIGVLGAVAGYLFKSAQDSNAAGSTEHPPSEAPTKVQTGP